MREAEFHAREARPRRPLTQADAGLASFRVRMPSSFLGHVVSQAFRRTRTRTLKWLGKRRDTPWMRPYEEDLVRDVLQALQPTRCLEWGGGLSTLQFPALLQAKATWRTIEHDAGWAKQLAGMVSRPGVTVVHVPPDDPAFTGDGDARSFAAYLAAADAGAPYDLIFIDGRARAACLKRAHRLLAPGGVVILHDANRAGYRAATSAFVHQSLFLDARQRRHTRVSGGVWIGGHQPFADRVPTLDLHQRLFAFYSGVGRVLA